MAGAPSASCTSTTCCARGWRKQATGITRRISSSPGTRVCALKFETARHVPSPRLRAEGGPRVVPVRLLCLARPRARSAPSPRERSERGKGGVRGRLKREGQLFGTPPSPSPLRAEYRAALSPQAGRGHNNENGTRGHISSFHASPHFTQPFSFPRRVFAPGFCLLLRSPGMRGGRSTERRTGAVLSTRGACLDAARQALVRRLASHNAGRSPLGAPPWRFWAGRRASPSPDLRPDRF